MEEREDANERRDIWPCARGKGASAGAGVLLLLDGAQVDFGGERLR